MDTTRKRSIDRYQLNVTTVRQFLAEMTERRMADLHRINDQSNDADGFPAGGNGDDGGRGSSDWTSTERAALLSHPTADPIGRAIDELFAGLVEMAGIAKAGLRKLEVIDNRPDLLRAKEEAKDRCQACQRWVGGGHGITDTDDIADPLDTVPGVLRSGYCSACFADWTRKARPDRPTFEKMRLNRHIEACSTETPVHAKGA